MTADTLTMIFSSLLALAMAYIPGLKTWYENMQSQSKALVMGVCLIVIAGVCFGLACAGLAGDLGYSLTCDKTGAIGLIQALLAALMANQGTYMLAVRPFKKSA